MQAFLYARWFQRQVFDIKPFCVQVIPEMELFTSKKNEKYRSCVMQFFKN